MNETIKKILIVDDDPDITNTFSVGLEDTGLFAVETYNDSVEASSNFQPYMYDFILLDIKMPEISGFELYDKMKRLDSRVKICFISAFDPHSAELEEQFLLRKIECFIPKPIQIKELVKRIEVELSR
jgi:DNA-binding response OmpR family regulator